MRSVRFDPELDAWLQQTARATGRPVSEIIREAVRRWRELREGDRIGPHLERIAGAIDTGGKIDSRKTGRAYSESLKKRRSKRR